MGIKKLFGVKYQNQHYVVDPIWLWGGVQAGGVNNSIMLIGGV